MSATPDTRLELYLQEPHNSKRATPLAVSLTIHAVLAVGLLLVHFDAVPAAIVWRTQAVLIAPVLPRATPVKRSPRAAPLKSPPKNAIPLPDRVEARAFHAPVKERAPVLRAVDAPAIAPPVPTASPVAISLPAAAPHLPVLPAPPMKTDNLSSTVVVDAATPNGKVESSGFGTSGVAARAASTNSALTTVGGFGSSTVDRHAAAETPRVSQSAFGNASVSAFHASAGNDAQRAVADTAVEILEKPKPKYTEEARRLGIEGEVLVEALFPASGPARVLRLIRGLGHGLDENAETAARAIRFRPATHAGQPVDSTAVVHIVFQIAF